MEPRKQNRLTEFDYSSNGAYFITICTKNREKILWVDNDCDTNFGTDNVGAVIGRPIPRLNGLGKIVKGAIKQIPVYYENVFIDKFVVMPNHVHILMRMDKDEFIKGRPMTAPTVSGIINQFKGYCTKQIGKSVWQKSFYDHIIRNYNEYLQIWQYIDQNPLKWELDEYYIE